MIPKTLRTTGLEHLEILQKRQFRYSLLDENTKFLISIVVVLGGTRAEVCCFNLLLEEELGIMLLLGLSARLPFFLWTW